MRGNNVAIGLVAFGCLLGCNEHRTGADAAWPVAPKVVTPTAVDRSAWEARRQEIASYLPEVERLVQQEVTKQRMPSLAAAVLVDGQLLWWRGYGAEDLERGNPVTAHTVYRIGSITKTMTGLALLRLRDEGRVRLDDPAEVYLPEFAEVHYTTADSPLITLRMLLTHTSGLPRLGKFDYAKKRSTPVTEREVLDSLRATKLENVPGTKQVYSNFGFASLGILISRVTGMSYQQYMSETMLAPLGMGGVAWHHDEVRDRLATGYVKNGGTYEARHHWLMGAADGMGGLYASLDDMVRFTSFNMTAWPPGARSDQQPLRNASVRESHMLGGWQTPSGQGTGIGWGVVKLGDAGQLNFHTGATHQYAATVMFLPHERLGFVGLTNCGQLSGPIDNLGGRVMALLYRNLHPKRRRSALLRRGTWSASGS